MANEKEWKLVEAVLTAPIIQHTIAGSVVIPPDSWHRIELLARDIRSGKLPAAPKVNE